MIDVSDILVDPDLATLFDVIRRKSVVRLNGRSEISYDAKPNVAGVVCAASNNQLVRLDDNQRMGRHLSIVTRFRLQGPAKGYMPDLVKWNGDVFVVMYLDPYPQYGVGFVQAIVGSQDSIDEQLPFLPPADQVFGGQAGGKDGDSD